MNKQILMVLLVFIGLNGYAQIAFEKGSFVNNQNEKIECLIKNVDWEDNPSEFLYKLSESSIAKTNKIESVKEFSIGTTIRYIRAEVNIDRSSDNVNDLSLTRNAVFEKETLLLKSRLEGKATLYSYNDNNLKRYFYKVDDDDIVQLVYKKYKSENKVGENSFYKQQLWNTIKCAQISKKEIETLNYKLNELIELFIKYNDCNSSNYILYENEVKKELFNLSLKIGLRNSSLFIQNSVKHLRDIEFDSQNSLSYGIEAEFILPFNKNKWSIILETTYQSFTTTKEDVVYSRSYSRDDYTTNVSVDYKSIELPVGLRYYLFINAKSKLFINGFFMYDFPINSGITSKEGIYELKIKSDPSFALGAGYNYRSKLSVEIRAGINRDLMNELIAWSSNYHSLSFIIGYSLF